MRCHVILLFVWLWSLRAEAQDLPPLPVAMSNHAVAAVSAADSCSGGDMVLVAGGLVEGKTWRHVSKRVYLFSERLGRSWVRMPDLPIEAAGVLAPTAEAIAGKFYIFGGYTVAEDGAEKSTAYALRFDPATNGYEHLAPMPLPVDDTVSFVYQDRYIYLVSGWHDDGNVKAVQIYDSRSNRWARARDFPGSPVFGHAGGIVGNKFVIADGVAVVGKTAEGRRKFDTVNQQWLGEIDRTDPRKITWTRLAQLPGKGGYRMAAAGDSARGLILFTGGTTNAYNYNGIGYNGQPSAPTAHTWAYDLQTDKMIVLPDWTAPTMDHRGLVYALGAWRTVGGMGPDQTMLKSAHPEN